MTAIGGLEEVMFGFLIGTLSLIGLIKVIRNGRGWGGHGFRGGGAKRWMLRRLFQRLDTTPGTMNAARQFPRRMSSTKDANGSRGIHANSGISL